MRTVLYGAACSLDGFIAGPSDEVDFLLWSDDVAAISSEVFQSIDTVIMGRKTYVAAVRLGTRSYPGVRNIVFSRTLAQSDAPEVEVVADDAVSFVTALVAQPGKGICVMGGGELAGALFSAGLIDEVGLNIQPVLLGSGIPMFTRIDKRISLELIDSRKLEGDCMYVRYTVKGTRS